MDAYHKLLAIPPDEQPPNHYRLLAIDLFESDREVISNAARARCQFLRSISLRSPEVSEPLLNEIMEAKVCLLDADRRYHYDRELRSILGTAAPATASSKIAVADPSGSRVASPLGTDLGDGSSVASDSWMLAPAASPIEERGEWIIGSSSRASIRVRAPWVSRRHCRLWRDGGATWIEDTASTNGTYVNEVPIDCATQLMPQDLVSLGRKTRLPWPLPPDCRGRDMQVFSIGRAPDCDCVLNDKSVSQHHAQLLIENDTIVLQDLDSLNGTRVGSLENRIDECELQPHESVYFGVIKIFAQDLIQTVRESGARAGV